MNDFEPKFIKIASKYLNEKLNSQTKEKRPRAYVVEKKKESLLTRFVNSIFRS
jgi:hypothetical protein